MKVLVHAVKEVFDLNNNKAFWLGGHLNKKHKYLNINPDFIKLLTYSEDMEIKAGDLFSMDDDQIPFPEDSSGWGFLGSNYNSVHFAYGLTSDIDNCIQSIENNFEKEFSSMDDDLIDSCLIYLTWNIDKDHKLIAVYNDDDIFNVSDILFKNNLLVVSGGMVSDDLLISEVLICRLSKLIIDIDSNRDLDDDTIDIFENYEVDDISEFISYNGNPAELESEILKLTKILLFDILKYKFDDKELKKRLLTLF